MTVDTPQDMVIFQCAFIYTNEGAVRRPRVLILSAPSVEGANTTKLVEQWIQAAKTANTFPAVHNLVDGTMAEAKSDDGLVASLNRIKAVPEVRVNRDHPAFGNELTEEGLPAKA